VDFLELTNNVTETYFSFIDTIHLTLELYSGVGYNNVSGNQNLFLGFEAGYKNTNSNDIIAIGTQSAYNNIASDLISIGTKSGYMNTEGFNNIYIGTKSGYNNQIGKDNILIGSDSGYNHTKNNLISIGFKSGYKNTIGENNIFIGSRTGYSNTIGKNNLFMGSGLELTYTTPTISDINLSLYDGLIVEPINTSFSTNNLISNYIFYNNLVYDSRFKIFASIANTPSDIYIAKSLGYGYISTYSTYGLGKFTWPSKEINGITFDKTNFPEGTLIYITYSDNRPSINSNIQSMFPKSSYSSTIPKIRKSNTLYDLSYDELFTIKYIDDTSFYLVDSNNIIVTLLGGETDTRYIVSDEIPENYFYYNTQYSVSYNYFYFNKFNFQINDIIGLGTNSSPTATTYVDSNIYKISTCSYQSLTLNTHYNNSSSNIKTQSITNLNKDYTIINYSNNSIKFVYPTVQSDNTLKYNSRFESILKFTTVAGINNSYLKLDFKVNPDTDDSSNITHNVQNYKKAFEIPIVKNDLIILRKNTSESILPSELNINTKYFISNIRYYNTNNNNILQEVNRIIIKGSDINISDSTFTYPISSNKFQNNDCVYVITNSKTPVFTQNINSKSINQYRYYYIQNSSDDINKFKLSLTADNSNLINFNPSTLVTNIGNTLSSDDYYIIVKTDDIDEVRVWISTISDSDSYEIIDTSLTIRNNSIIVGEIPYMSNNTNTYNELSTSDYDINNNLVNIYNTSLIDTPYILNKSGNWWGRYTQNNLLSWYNNIHSIYYEFAKENSQNFTPSDNLYINIPDNVTHSTYSSISSEITNISNIDSLYLKAIVTITDSNNNFIEERIYFTISNNSDVNSDVLINNLNTFLNTSDNEYEHNLSLTLSIPKSTGYSNITGNFNTFLGEGSGFSNTYGDSNTFLGSLSGYKNKTGVKNIYIGQKSGYSNISGENNIVIGTEAGYNNKENDNIFIGTQSGYNNYYGEHNIFLGKLAGYNNTSSSKNILLGEFTGKYTGSQWHLNTRHNIFIGSGAGYSNTIGGSNILLGENSGYTIKESSNKVIIENVTKSNTYNDHNNNNTLSYMNQKYIVINSMIDFNINDYATVINSNNDSEIIKIVNKNTFETTSNIYTYGPTDIKFVLSINKLNEYSYIESSDLLYDFSQNTIIKSDFFINIASANSQNNGIFLVKSITSPTSNSYSKIYIFTGETYLGIHFPLYNTLTSNTNITGSITTPSSWTALTSSNTQFNNTKFLPNKINYFNRSNTNYNNAILLNNTYDLVIPNINNPEQADLFNNSINSGGKRTHTTMFWFKITESTNDIFTTTIRKLDGTATEDLYKIRINNLNNDIANLVIFKSTSNSTNNHIIGKVNMHTWYHLSIVVNTTSNIITIYLNGIQTYLQISDTYSEHNSLISNISLSNFTNYNIYNNNDYRIFFRLHQNNNFHDLRIYFDQSSAIIFNSTQIKFMYDAYIDDNIRIPGTNEDNTNRDGLINESILSNNVEINTNLLLIDRNVKYSNKLESLNTNLIVWYSFDEEYSYNGFVIDSNSNINGAILNKNESNPYTAVNTYSGDVLSYTQYKTGKILNCMDLNNEYYIRIGKTNFTNIDNNISNLNIIEKNNILNGGDKFTITTWIKLNSIPSQNNYYSIYSSALYENNSFATDRGFNLYIIRHDDNNAILAIHDARNNKNISSTTGMVYLSNTIKTLTVNEWYFISLKHETNLDNTSYITLYINDNYHQLDNISNGSKIVDINSASDTNYSNDQIPLIGNYQNTDNFDGLIDDFRFYDTILLDEDIIKLYKQQIKITKDSDFILLKTQTTSKENVILPNDTEIYIDKNKYFTSGNYCRIDNEIIQVINVENNILYVKRNSLGTIASTHSGGQLISLYKDYKLLYGDTSFNHLDINMPNNTKNKIGNNEVNSNLIESPYCLGIGGSIGINGEIIMNTTIPKEPLDGHCMLWYSDGNDDTFNTNDNYVTNSKLSRGLYIAYKPVGLNTQYTRVIDLTSTNTNLNNWSNPYISKDIDTNNIIHCTFKNEDNYGLPNNITLPFRLKNTSNISLTEGLHWVSGVGNLELVGSTPIDFYELKVTHDHEQTLSYDTNNYTINTWQVTDKFLLSQGNTAILNNTNDYIIPSTYSSNNGYSKIVNNILVNRPYKLQGSNYENAICVPNTGPQISKINGIAYKENSYLVSPYFIIGDSSNSIRPQNYWGAANSSSSITISKDNNWFNSSRIITFDSFNNTDGYWPATWYTSQISGTLYDKEQIKYRIITTDDIANYSNSNNYILSLAQLQTIFNNKKWINLKGRRLNTNNMDTFYDDIETDIQVRSYEVDKTNSKYAGSDGTDADEGIGWLTYEATIPKCIGFQIIFTYSTENISFGPSQNHVSGWYLRNLKIFKKK